MNKQWRGYTVVEVMIFLAVTGVLFVFAIRIIGGQQKRTQFTQAVRDVQSKVGDYLNDVSNGFVPQANQDYECRVNSGAPQIISGSSTGAGKNINCIFVGKVLQFSNSGSNNATLVYTLVGLRSASRLEDARILPVDDISLSAGGSVSLTEFRDLQYGLKVKTMKNGATNIGAMGLFTTFNNEGGTYSATGAVNVDIRPILNTSVAQSKTELKNALNVPANLGSIDAGGITICFSDSSDSLFASLNVARSTRDYAVETNFEISGCP